MPKKIDVKKAGSLVREAAYSRGFSSHADVAIANDGRRAISKIGGKFEQQYGHSGDQAISRAQKKLTREATSAVKPLSQTMGQARVEARTKGKAATPAKPTKRSKR